MTDKDIFDLEKPEENEKLVDILTDQQILNDLSLGKLNFKRKLNNKQLKNREKNKRSKLARKKNRGK